MFRVNYRDLVNQVIAFFLRKDKFKNILFSIIKPLSTLNNNDTVIEFFDQKNQSLFPFTEFITNFLNFDARTIYLQKYLNDRYDSTNEGILIVNNNTTLDVVYLFNSAENADPTYFYNNWDTTISYVAGGTPDRIMYKNIIYLSAANSTGVIPLGNPAEWTDEGEMQFLFNNEDIFTSDYTIEIPQLVTLQPDYSDERIQAQINFFNAAGRTYQGVVKELSVGDPGYLLFTKT